jgi:hypothetical protein
VWVTWPNISLKDNLVNIHIFYSSTSINQIICIEDVFLCVCQTTFFNMGKFVHPHNYSDIIEWNENMNLFLFILFLLKYILMLRVHQYNLDRILVNIRIKMHIVTKLKLRWCFQILKAFKINNLYVSLSTLLSLYPILVDFID